MGTHPSPGREAATQYRPGITTGVGNNNNNNNNNIEKRGGKWWFSCVAERKCDKRRERG